jgi:pilus assembly protein CpaF
LHKCLSQSETQINIRRHRDSSWSLEDFCKNNWASEADFGLLREIVSRKLNFLVVGATGSGKTSLVNALLAEVPRSERSIVIEDTQELHLPHRLCTRLLGREGLDSGLSAISPGELLKCALRLRPDRLVMGEIRGEEAKDFLLLLSTGHPGSFGTLHAETSQQAIMRLEMLIQMGAPQWSLDTVRRLIHQCLQIIIVVEKKEDGSRGLREIFKIQSLESFGFTMERLYTLSA